MIWITEVAELMNHYIFNTSFGKMNQRGIETYLSFGRNTTSPAGCHRTDFQSRIWYFVFLE